MAAPAEAVLPHPNRGMERGTNEENIVVEVSERRDRWWDFQDLLIQSGWYSFDQVKISSMWFITVCEDERWGYKMIGQNLKAVAPPPASRPAPNKLHQATLPQYTHSIHTVSYTHSTQHFSKGAPRNHSN